MSAREIEAVPVQDGKGCRDCGHAEADHRGRWGPNSNGQFGGAYCVVGWVRCGPEIVQGAKGCECEVYRAPSWLRRLRKATQ